MRGLHYPIHPGQTCESRVNLKHPGLRGSILTCNPSMELSRPPLEHTIYGFWVIGWMHWSFRASMRAATCIWQGSVCWWLLMWTRMSDKIGEHTSLTASELASGLNLKKTICVIAIWINCGVSSPRYRGLFKCWLEINWIMNVRRWYNSGAFG